MSVMNIDVRPMNKLERSILAEINKNPGQGSYDLAEKFDHSTQTYAAIYFLVFCGYADQDHVTGAITARKLQ
jgi:hypothetical protein